MLTKKKSIRKRNLFVVSFFLFFSEDLCFLSKESLRHFLKVLFALRKMQIKNRVKTTGDNSFSKSNYGGTGFPFSRSFQFENSLVILQVRDCNLTKKSDSYFVLVAQKNLFLFLKN